jgi:phosphopantothenoylcysteine decarboxylase / phosphopantothenate---cysteine ligase
MQALSGRPVFTSQWDAREPNNMAHINLTRGADAVLVAPASADFIAQLAQGRADDLLSCCAWRARAPRCRAAGGAGDEPRDVGAPGHAAQRGADARRRRPVLGPGSGEQACGEVGDGRMLEAAELRDELIAHFQPKAPGRAQRAGDRRAHLRGHRPGARHHQPVQRQDGLRHRARRAAEAGAEVTLVAGPVHLPTPRHVRRIDVQSAREMFDAVLPLAPQHQVFVATAAVADWRPAQAEHKIKKDGKKAAPPSAWPRTPTSWPPWRALPARPAPWCVGFAAESHDLLAHARAKRERKGVPLIVGNLGPATFGATTTRCCWSTPRAPPSCRRPTS